MRWQRLFDDLEAQIEAAGSAELAGEVAERSRREAALLHLLDRLAPARGSVLSVAVLGAGSLSGTLQEVGSDWLLLRDGPSTQAVVPLAALASVSGLDRRTAAPGSLGIRARLGLAHVLRGLARDRAAVMLTLIDGARLTGTLDLVGADFVEVAEHPAGEPRRPGAVRCLRVVPLAALALVRAG